MIIRIFLILFLLIENCEAQIFLKKNNFDFTQTSFTKFAYIFVNNDGARDYSPSGFNGTVTNAVASITDPYGVTEINSYDCDGTGDYIIFSNTFAFTSSYTVCVWARREGTTSNDQVIFSIGETSTRNVEIACADDGTLWAGNDNNGFSLVVTSAGVMATNVWVHIALQHDNTRNKIYLYVNGVYYGSAAKTGLPTSYAAGWEMIAGAFPETHANGFNGRISQIIGFDRLLSAEEIYRIYQSGLKGTR